MVVIVTLALMVASAKIKFMAAPVTTWLRVVAMTTTSMVVTVTTAYSDKGEMIS